MNSPKLSYVFYFFILTACARTNFIAGHKLREEKPRDVTITKIPQKKGAGKVLTPTPELENIQIPKSAFSWDADVYMVNFDEEQEKKVLAAVHLIKKVIASKEFKERIINYQYDGKKTFFNNGGFSNEEIYHKILEGAEQIGNTSKNNVMDVELELYTQSTSTIGYTYPNTVRIWMNRKYFNKYTPINVADNLMHEWMHKLGFVHATTWSKSRDHSVPYAVGYIVEELAAKYAEQ